MAREGTAFHHRSLLSHNLLSLRVLSCVNVTIRGFVFFSFSCDCFSLDLLLFCSLVLLSQNGRLFVFLRNIYSSIEILKIKIPEYSYPPSQYFFVTKAFFVTKVVFFCPGGRSRCANLAERHISETWLNDTNDDKLWAIDNDKHKLFRCDITYESSKKLKGGGVMLLVPKS